VVVLAVPTLIGTFQMYRYNKINNNQKEIFQKEDNISKKTDKERIEKPDRIAANSSIMNWKGFSIQENFKEIMSTDVAEGSLSSLNGIRGITVNYSITKSIVTFN
jgi:hypothetical protein